jgi:hypothetical protein
MAQLARDAGGRVIASSSRSVGFSLRGPDGSTGLYKYVLEGDAIVLEVVAGSERGRRAEVTTLSEMRRAS